MVSSMTGYAVASAESPGGALTLELRSVNARFLDVSLRIAEEQRAAEPLLREMIGARISRGKVDCRVSFENSLSQEERRLNPRALQQLQVLAGEVLKVFPAATPLRVADVLRWPGVLAEPAADEARTRAALQALMRTALDELCAAREREGAKLATALRARVAEMRRCRAVIAPLVPEAIAAYRARIGERLREALGAADEERALAEAVLFAAKSDVDEELTRLDAHLDEVERVLAKGGAAGKRLDFLAQELNREANTIASKAAGLKIADGAMELKLLIEQVREQAQNIE
jgi:uncharacterized protein (TIGR00255 family)